MEFSVPEELKNSLRLTCAVLLAGGDKDFRTLKKLTKATDGNLSVQLSHLEEAGFLTAEKGYLGKRPRTVYRLSAHGRAVLTGYLALLQQALSGATDMEKEE